ncbi:MAG: hypothetical protein LBR10_03495 [Prevotellaceae bacterium]|jgi:hypothetical protein|nr:hypothetical protein [Prevotellaceae bacterium]
MKLTKALFGAMFLAMFGIPASALGQTEQVEQADTVTVQPKPKEEPVIKMSISMELLDMQLTQPQLLLPPPGSAGYYDVNSMLRFTPKYNAHQMTLNMKFTPPPKFINTLKEEPLKVLLVGGAMLLGRMNHHIQGEDKNMQIRLEQMMRTPSHSGVSETAKTPEGTTRSPITK